MSAHLFLVLLLLPYCGLVSPASQQSVVSPYYIGIDRPDNIVLVAIISALEGITYKANLVIVKMTVQKQFETISMKAWSSEVLEFSGVLFQYITRVANGFCVTRDGPQISSVTRDGAKISRVMRDWTSQREAWFSILQARDAWFTY